MHILDHVDRRFRLGKRCRVDDRRQPAPAGICSDIGNGKFGVGDTQEVFEQKQVARVGIGRTGCAPERAPRHRPDDSIPMLGAKQSREPRGTGHRWCGIHSAAVTTAAPTRCKRSRLAGQPALADAGQSDEVDDAAGASDGLIENRGEKVEFTCTPDECRLAAMTRLMFFDGQQSVHPNRRDSHP